MSLGKQAKILNQIKFIDKELVCIFPFKKI
jgi:hypothetical protein